MATITTTEAANQAGVTIATIRHWCRYGAVAAIKAGRRWAIDTASLAHRIALGIRRTRKAKPMTLTPEALIAIGGNRWQRGDKDRVYINDWTTLAGLEISHYKTGNISSASYQGEGISNRQAGLILGCIDKVWFDAADGKLHCRYGWTNPRMTREQVWDDIAAGIRAAVAAL